MNILRNYIRNLILEAMKSPSSISNDYAIWSTEYWLENPDEIPENTEMDFVLYNVPKAKELVQMEINKIIEDEAEPGFDELELLADYTGDIISSGIGDAIAAVIRVRTPGQYGNCNKAWEVIRSAAEGGLGPTLYDLVMSIAPHGIMSDRSSVSRDAQNIWGFYAKNRRNIDKQYLDDADIEVTWQEDDDCNTHGGRGADMLKNAQTKMFWDWVREEWEEIEQVLRYGYEQDGDDVEEYLTSQDAEELLHDYENFYQYYEDVIQDELGIDPADIDPEKLNDEWMERRMDGEPSLYDDYPPNFEEEEPKSPLNLNYNTDYAESSYYSMTDNHSDFIQWCTTMNLDEDFIDESGDTASLLVRDFFNKHN